MNYFAFIPLAAFIVSFFTWTYIYAQKRKNPVNRAYLIFAAFAAGWAIAVFMIWLPLKNPLILPMLKMGSVFWLMVGFCFLNFIHTFLERKRDSIYYFYLISSFISILISLSTDLYIDGYTRHYWGVTPVGILYVPISLIITTSPFFYALFLVYNKLRNADLLHYKTKKQLSLIFQGASIGVCIGFLTQIIFPYLFKIEIIHLGSSGVVVLSLFVFKAINKYKFLSIGVEEVAEDLFINVGDSVVLADTNGSIIQINESAKDLFHLRDSEIQNLKISTLFENYDFNESYKNYETTIFVDSEPKDISLTQATVRQSNIELGKILIVRDITESKEAERALQESKTTLEQLAGELVQVNASLEQKVAERTRSLLKSNEQLQREIAERKRAEEALAAEKERLSVTLRSIGDGVVTTDTAGHIVLLNEAAEHLTGWHQAEALGKSLETVFRVFDEKTRASFQSPVEEALSTDSIVSRTEHTLLVSKDGTERIIAESAAPIRNTEGRVFGVVLVFRDMTDRRKIEEELLKADKLESIGVVAGGIAHDFNNILTAIIGNISLGKIYTSAEDKVFARLVNAEKAALQAQNLTQQLLSFSKGGSLVLRPTSIGDVIQDCIDFSLRGSNVKCEFDLTENVWPVEIDQGQISQVINNLIINADQSMPEGGVINVCVENIQIDDGDSDHLHPLQKGRYVRISVKDSGAGIPEEHLQKIFDPYFTTKQQGSGLGLFTCYSIVKRHHGYLTVESEESVGSTFYVYLPASEKRVRKTAEKQAVDVAGRGKILIMEDDETIRDVTGDMLGHFGYEVAFARDGTEAIDLYRREQEVGRSFDVIIMDLTIPGGMGAKETIAEILELNPQAKAIVASGYANNPIMLEYHQYGFCGRIVKPYNSEELHEILHGILNNTDA